MRIQDIRQKQRRRRQPKLAICRTLLRLLVATAGVWGLYGFFTLNATETSDAFDRALVQLAFGQDNGSLGSSWTCNDFFAILSNIWVPAINETCTETYEKQMELLSEHNSQMKSMNATLTLFTTWTPQEKLEPGCNLDRFDHIVERSFDPEPLLLKHGFTPRHLEYMKLWGGHEYRSFNWAITRLSDIFRIVLQREHGMAYSDLDLVYLSTDKSTFLHSPNVAVPVWSEIKGALEIQNSAFCFSPEQLDILIHKAKQIIDRKGDRQLDKNVYQYTELGPMLFQHALPQMQQAGTLQLYYTNSDDHWKVEDVAGLYDAYDRSFPWLHIDRSNRRRNWYRNKQRTYRQLIAEFREKCKPPQTPIVTDN